MMFYAYKPDKNGDEPMGTSGKIIRRDMKTERGFIRYAKRILGDTARCFRIEGDRFYNPDSHKEIR